MIADCGYTIVLENTSLILPLIAITLFFSVPPSLSTFLASNIHYSLFLSEIII